LEEIDLDNIPLYSKEDSDEVSDNNEIADTFDDTVVWMFQCNPKYYDIFSDLENHDRLTWSVRQHRKQIKKGHKVYLWLSGSDGGIIATGKIICDPELRKHVDDSQYWIGAPRESERLQVDIQIERKQIKPPLVSRSVLRENGQTKELKIFGYAQGTNYPVTNSQETAIDGIIKGLGKRIEYTESKFLGEVFLDPKLYRTLTTLLLRKKNVILKGAPGVGKTFAAKKLAFSMMGEKDEGRVAMVQFHQSYSYEDFVMGYRPNAAGGFDLVEGPFYKFCERAAEDPDRQYFFIIDEINRGNLSKVFGELLMLIEDDKRGQYIRLMYTGERFSVPKNLYVVGMMNTADRSLAMMDYALRRRFAFFDMGPAFGSNGFMEYQKRINNPKFDRLISEIKSLNEKIQKDESLGAGFRIGHSYFCTDGTITDEWLSSVVEYELIPLLEEYWFDEPLNVERWSAQLRGVLNG
jgi:MoxR-like ATPase